MGGTESVFCRSARVQAVLLLVVLAIAGFRQQCKALDAPQKGILRIENQLSEQWVNVLVALSDHEVFVVKVNPKEQKDLEFICTSGSTGLIEREDGLKAEIPCTSFLERGYGRHLNHIATRQQRVSDKISLTAYVKDSGIVLMVSDIRKIEWSH